MVRIAKTTEVHKVQSLAGSQEKYIKEASAFTSVRKAVTELLQELLASRTHQRSQDLGSKRPSLKDPESVWPISPPQA